MKKSLLMLFLAISSLLAHAQTAVAPAGSGTSTDPYQIDSLSNLYWLSQDTSAWNKYIIQTADIDASDTRNWNVANGTAKGFSPIGYFSSSSKYFSGNYNGKGHSISNLYIKLDSSNYVGLFGYVYNGNIDSLNIENAYVYGGNHTGTLAGYVRAGGVTNCSSSGVVLSDTLMLYTGGLIGDTYSSSVISNCSSSATVTGYDCAGGLIGRNDASTISDSYSNSNVTGYIRVGGFAGDQEDASLIKNAYSTGSVNGTSNVGGFIGTSNSTKYKVINCYSKSTVVGNTSVGGFAGKMENGASHCYSTGDVTAEKSVGGFVGENDGFIYYSYSTGNVTGTSESKNVGGFAGYSYLASLISKSYSTGNVLGYTYMGGFIGNNYYSTADNCYCTGNVVSINLAKAKYVGGFIGYNYYGSGVTNCYSIGNTTNLQSATYTGAFTGYNSTSTLKNSYWNSQTSTQTTGIGWDNNSQTVIGLTTAQMKQSANFNAWNFDTVWTIRTDSTYPMLQKIENAPIAAPDSLSGATINFTSLLANDIDYKTLQTDLTYNIVSSTTHYGSLTDSTFTFGTSSTDSLRAATLVEEGSADTLTYRIGRIIAVGDTLWGNQTTAKLVYVADNATAIANATPATTLSISPNPATDAFTVNGLSGSATVDITDVSGKLLIAKSVSQGKAITVSSLPTGVYLIKISTANGVVQKKLIKK